MKKTKVKPIGNMLLVKPEPMPDRVGAIWLPDAAKEKPQFCEVLARGDDSHLAQEKRIAPAIQPGVKIIASRYGGTEIKIEGEEFKLVSADDVLAIIEA